MSLEAHQPQEGNVSAILGTFASTTPFFTSAPPRSSPWLGGTGLVTIGDINSKGSLEVGLFHLNRAFFRKVDGKHLAEATEMIHISMGYRRWWTSTFSTSLSFYSSYSMGKPNVIYTDFSPTDTVSTSARDITEYGFDFGLQRELMRWGKAGLTVEGRYSRSVTPKSQENADHLQFFVGLMYLLQEKFPAGSRP